jgi:hypothetical protein
MLLQSFCLMTALLLAQAETTFTVEYRGKKYDFRVTDQELSRTPAWPAAEENPPLSARRAIEIAAKHLATLLPDGKDWRLHQVTLKPVDDRWIYLVEFLEPLRGDGSGQQLYGGFQIVVLMNGVPVAPR